MSGRRQAANSLPNACRRNTAYRPAAAARQATLPPLGRITGGSRRSGPGVRFGAVLLLLLAPLGLQAEPRSQARALASAPPGAIVLEAKNIPSLHGKSANRIHVLAARGGALSAIPFQVDRRDRRDRWVIREGPWPTRDDRPGVFDPNDAIIFLRRDLGTRVEAGPFPSSVRDWHEVRLGAHAAPDGFVYIGVGDAPPRPAPPLVRYDPSTDVVYAERYAVGFDAPLPSHIALVDALGDYGRNIISRSSFIGEVNFLGSLITLRRTQDDLEYKVRGYSPGVVRLTRRTRYWLSLPFGLRGKGRVDLLCYPDFVEGTARVKMKIPPRYVLADGWLRTSFDFLGFEDSRLLRAVASENDRSAGGGHGRPERWAALQLSNGRSLLLVTRLEGALQELGQRVYFSNVDASDGGRPTFGFLFSDLARLDVGTYHLSIFAVLLDTLDSDSIRSTAAFFLSPPSVTVTRVPNSTYG